MAGATVKDGHLVRVVGPDEADIAGAITTLAKHR
jgi:hypothetical protein